jgi:O-antigen/teichoic acid export membrane protein
MNHPEIPDYAPEAEASAVLAAVQAPYDKHFCTKHLLHNLRGRVISGGLVTAMAQAAKFGLYVLSTIVLSRTLAREDFGLVAMVGTLTALLRLFRESGLATATIQVKDITHAQVSNLFWINVLLGIGAAAIGAMLSPFMAWFYREPRLIGITLVLASTFILSGSATQHLALLSRQMRFKAMACVDIGAILLSLIVGVVMALCGYGYWSLVGSQLALSLGELALAWTLSGWRPQFYKTGVGTRSMIHFGASLTVSTVSRRITGNMDSILIGRVYGAAPLGLYTRGMALLMRPLDQFLLPFDTVFVPMLSRLQDLPERYRRTFLEIYDALVLASYLMAGLLLGLSRPLVLALLGPRWEEVVPIFAALAIAAAYYAATGSSIWLLTTQGRNRDIIWTGLMVSSISVASYVVGLKFGVTGVALAFSLGGLLIRLPLQNYIVGRSGPVSSADLWRVLLRHVPVWAVAFGAAYASSLAAAKMTPLLQLCVGVPATLAASLAIIWILPHQRQTAQRVIREMGGFLSKMTKRDAVE